MFVIIAENNKRLIGEELPNLYWRHLELSEVESDEFQSFSTELVETYNGRKFKCVTFENLATDLWQNREIEIEEEV